MNKLEVGMYAYIKEESRDYGIGKIREIHTNGFDEKQVVIVFKHSTHSVGYSSVVASYNIIDLIEVGDYVNGYYVSKIWESGEITHYVDEKPIQRKERQITIQAPSYGGIIHLHNKDIKSIVTKEQFSSMEYRLGDK